MSALNAQPAALTELQDTAPLAVVPSPIDGSAELLASNLSRQADMHQRLLELARMQTEAIRARTPEVIDEILAQIDQVLLERIGLEMQRNQLVGRIALELGVDPTGVDIRQVTQAASDRVASGLVAASRRLTSVLAELEPVVHVNRALMEQELELIDGVVRMATTTQERATYERPGASGTAQQSRSLLDLQG